MEAVLDLLRDTKVGCMVALRPPEEEGGGTKGEEGASTALDCIFPLFFLLFFHFVSFSFPFVKTVLGKRRQGNPTITGYAGIRQD